MEEVQSSPRSRLKKLDALFKVHSHIFILILVIIAIIVVIDYRKFTVVGF